MAQYNSFPFQQKAIDELVETFKTLWQTNKYQLPITFKSPTGSGKTFMVTHFVDALNRQPDWDEDVAYVWITFSDDLAMQSRNKFYDYFFPNLSNQLLTISNFNQGVLKRKDILFLNWQKLVSKRAADRVLRRSENEELRKEQGFYFEDVVERTHAEGRQIVMIIDESHKNVTEAAIRDVNTPLNPRIILKVSATPEEEPTASQLKHHEAGFVEVERKDVVEAGLIKEEILSQTEEDLNRYEQQDNDTLLLDLAIEKRNVLVAEWKSIGEKINPLVLIQLPNDDKKTKDTEVKTKEEIVTEYLTTKRGVKKEHIAYWFDGRRENMDGITEKDSKVDFMLFKYAAGTGWDCPRAHILVMYREIKSNTFHTQTLGRILRMPIFGKDLSCHPMLRTGYLYTNYQRNEVQNPADTKSENTPKTLIVRMNTTQKVKMSTQDAVRKLTEKLNVELGTTPDKKEKIQEVLKLVVPQLAESAKTAAKISENQLDILQKEAKINEVKIATSSAVEKTIKGILGDSVNDKPINLTIDTIEMIDNVVDDHRDAEFILDPCLLTDFISRTDYGDIGKASVFQSHFKKSMNKYFDIDANKTYNADEQKQIFERKKVSTSTTLERDVVVNARFITDEENEENDLGKNVKYEVSNNDVEKEFSWRCYEILGDQADEKTGIGNVARTWGSLKEAIRQWFNDSLSYYNTIDQYKVFLNDVNKGDTSVFRNAIRQALIDYRPRLDDYLKQRREKEELQKPRPFVLKTQYAQPNDYKQFLPSAKSHVQPFCLPEKYNGRENETEFITYLEKQTNGIEWWFKNGTGRDALGIKYTDSQTKEDRIFYPDWLIMFNDKRIGIFDTKGGFTAKSLETKDKAEALAHRIESLNNASEYKYVGGIIEKRNNEWFYNDSLNYVYENNEDWKSMNAIF